MLLKYMQYSGLKYRRRTKTNTIPDTVPTIAVP